MVISTPAAGGMDAMQNNFCDGQLLAALLDRLERLLDHSLEGNLVLTGTLAKLAQWPDPLLHMALFDERPRDFSRTVQPFPRSMRRTLVEVWVDARKRIERIPQFEDKLASMRKELGADKVGEAADGEDGTKGKKGKKHQEAALARGPR
jgi:hypothetical protein